MTWVPTEPQIHRAEVALAEARGMQWSLMRDDFKKEHRRQVVTILVAAMNEAPARPAKAAKAAPATDQVDLEELLK